MIDAGTVSGTDLSGRLVKGDDLIGDTTVSNDDYGRNTDASDPDDASVAGITSDRLLATARPGTRRL